MNPKRLMIVVSLGMCLLFGGLTARAIEIKLQSRLSLDGLKSADEAVRLQTIDQCTAEGPKAAEAVAPLAELLKDNSATVRAHAASALGSIGAPAKSVVPAIIELLKDSDPTVRRQAVKAVMKIRPGPQVTLPLLIKLIEDSDAGVRIHILNAISEVGPMAVPGLIEALKNDKASYWACLILREMGPAGKAAIPALIEKIGDPRPEVRREAILALASMEKESTSAIEPIAKALDDKTTCAAATYALGRIGSMTKKAEATIQANTQSDDAMLSTASLWALARVHPEDKQLRIKVTEKLIARLKDQDPLVRVAAARGLASLPPAPEITIPIWEKALSDSDETTILHALDALATLGPTAVPNLIDAIKYEKARGPVVYVLGQIGPPAAPATQALAQLIDDKNERLAKEAILTLAKIGPGAKDAVSALIRSLKKDDNVNTHALVYALGKIGPDAIEAEPSLLDNLKNADRNLVLVSAWALANIHPDSPEVKAKTIPILTDGLTDDLALIRAGAAEALGKLGPSANDALSALQKAMNDDDKNVRDAAAKAVHLIRNGDAK